MTDSNELTVTSIDLLPTYIHTFFIDPAVGANPFQFVWSGYLSTDPAGPLVSDTTVNGEVVQLQYFDGTDWVFAAGTTTGAGYGYQGHFGASFTMNLPAGQYQFRAHYVGSGYKNLIGCTEEEKAAVLKNVTARMASNDSPLLGLLALGAVAGIGYYAYKHL